MRGGREYRLINTGVQGWGTLQKTRYALDHFEDFAPEIVVITFCRNDPSDSAYFLKKGHSFDAVWFPGKVFLRNNPHLYRFLNRQVFLVLFSLYTRSDDEEKGGALRHRRRCRPRSHRKHSRWRSVQSV